MTIRTSIAWTFSEQVLQYGLQFAASIIIARLLTPDEMGIFALAMSASAFLISLRTLGIGNYLIREPELDLTKIRSAFGIMLATSWSLGLVLFLSRDLVAGFYERDGIAEAMALLALSFVVSPLGAPAAALLAREMRFRVLHNIGFASSAAGAVVSVALAYLGFSYMALVWGLLASTGLHAVGCMLAMPQYALLRPSFTHWRGITEFGGLLSLTALIGTANAEGAKFILGAFTNPAGVAQFNRAGQIPNLSRRGIFDPVGRVLLPAWSKNVRQGLSIGPAVEKLVSLNTVLVWPAFLALGFIAEPFIVLVFGENWRPAGEILPWLLLAHSIVAMLPQPEQVLVPYGLVRRLLALRVLAAVFSLSTAAYGASLGLEAFAILRVAAAVFLTVLTYLAIRPLITLRLGTFAALYSRSGLVAVVAAVPAAILHYQQPETLTLQELTVVAGSCGLLWVGGLAVTRHVVLQEGMSILRVGLGRAGLGSKSRG